MKSLHRPDLYAWSVFDEARNMDFNSLAWVREGGNVLVDPLPMTPHDEDHLRQLGGAAWIVITNGDHVRSAAMIARTFGSKIAAPSAERASLGGVPCDRFVDDGDEIVSGLRTIALHGSKTAGEIALLLDDQILITGDLVRAPRGGELAMLPAAKLADRAQAVASIERLAALPKIQAVLVGDGWPIFREGHARLVELCARLRAPT